MDIEKDLLIGLRDQIFAIKDQMFAKKTIDWFPRPNVCFLRE